jgi:hypothetical protein
MQRTILVILPLAVAAIGFYLLVLAPKREEASKLEAQATELEAQVDEQEAAAEAAESARKDFPRAYRRLVVLGKATPTDDDTSSLIVQLSRISRDSGVEFDALQASTGSGAAEAAPPPAPAQTPADTAAQDEQRVADAEAAADPAAAAADPAGAPPAPTEAQASLLPIGAEIGPAGLPVMKYTLDISGDFFELADFLAEVDDLVTTRADGSLGVRGRLITVDSFDLSNSSTETTDPTAETTTPSDPGNPTLNASLTLTTFLTPAEEGATGGASPTGPAPVTVSETPAPAPEAPPATASTTTP